MKPKIVSRSVIWTDAIQTIESVEIELVDGSTQRRVVTKQLPGAVIAAINDKNEILLIEGYRLAVEQPVLELPAGKIEAEDTPLEGAKRELLEETGLVGERWESLGTTFGAQGASDWTCHFFLATDLKQVEDSREAHETHTLNWTPLATCWQWMEEGRICNNFSIVGLLKTMIHLKKIETVS